MKIGKTLMGLRSRVFAGCLHTGFARAAFLAQSAPIQYVVLCYHGVADQPSPLFTTTRLLEQHLRFFKTWGTVATMDELVCFLKGMPVPGGPRTRFILTFDDGYSNVVKNAVPLLRQFEAKAVVYVNPEWMGQGLTPWWFLLVKSARVAAAVRNLLPPPGPEPGKNGHWLQLATQVNERVPQEEQAAFWTRVMQDVGSTPPGLADEYGLAAWPDLLSAQDVICLGSHTNSHAILGLCRDVGFAQQQLQRAKAAIEDKTQKPCLHFAYPRGRPGDFNDLTRSWLAQCGHKTAVTTVPDRVHQNSDPLALPRFFVAETSVAALASQLAGIAAVWDASMHRARKLFGRAHEG